ncbi:MAG: ATP-grasp domain-containing protein [archaeon]|nr:ATP-grasp domain-containing protein [archaeon]
MINTNNEDSFLVFEYFAAAGEKDKSIISEAEALLFSLVDDLKDEQIQLLLHESYKDKLDLNPNITPIFINENVETWLIKNANSFNKAIFIAGENNMNLYKFTKILEDNDVTTFTSSANACEICSNKFTLYEELYGIVPQPKTSKFTFDFEGGWITQLTNLYNSWQGENPFNPLKIILKPIHGIDCENIIIINNVNEITEDIELKYALGETVVVQEFIEGEDISVSLICDGRKAIPLSLNSQLIEITDENTNYLGGQLPFESQHKYEAFYIATRAVESIEGLKGFVGVDLRINTNPRDINDLYLLEINSRFTTPYVGLKKVANFNIGKTIVDLLDKKLNIENIDIVLDGKVTFKKENNTLTID